MIMMILLVLSTDESCFFSVCVTRFPRAKKAKEMAETKLMPPPPPRSASAQSNKTGKAASGNMQARRVCRFPNKENPNAQC